MLELIDVRRRFGDAIALDGLTFIVPAGQVFGFLGPNGAGKTTAMRAVFGVTALDAGGLIHRRAIMRTGERVRLRQVLGRAAA